MSEARQRIFNGIDRVDNLPTMPENATFLLMALQDEMVNQKKIVPLISRDMAISANVLRVANSAFYAFCSKPIASVDRAVARIGLNEVRNIVTASGVIQAFSAFCKKTNSRQFWRHSVCVALITEVLRPRVMDYRLNNDPDAGHSIYLGGLMHDVGLLLLGNIFPALYDKLLQICEEKNVPLKKVERQIMDTTHGEIGAYLCEKWNLPPEVIDIVKFHHIPDAAPEETRPYVQLVHLAKYVCVHEGLGSSGAYDENTFYENALYELGLEVDNLPDIVERIRVEAEKGLAIVSEM